MASKVSSGQSEIYRSRMLPVVSSSAHSSLPRDGRKDTQKTRSGSVVTGRSKTQAHGFKPLFPPDANNFVSKIVDRNSQDFKDTKDPKPRIVTPVSSVARPSSYLKETHKEEKEEEKIEAPPKLPPRKRLPSQPSSTRTQSNLPVRTDRRTLPSPRVQEQTSNKSDRTQYSVPSQSYRTQNHHLKSKENESSSLPVRTERRSSQIANKDKNLTSVRKENSYNLHSETALIQDTRISEQKRDAKPLTRTNVTQHDKIWVKDEPKHEPGTLVPPLQDITPETTEELWNNYDPLDALDSASDSSADTMIMMTTEEEQRNDEKIQKNQKTFENTKSGSTNELTPTMETINPIGMQNGGIGIQNGGTQYLKHSKDIDLSPKSSEEDDGYGTNSSTSTNFSSSLSLLANGDLEQKPLHGILKKTGQNMTNGINTSANSYVYNTSQNGQSNTTWAVKRRTKMTESQDNSLQEKLRQLAIIEEENTHEENQEDRLGTVRRNSDAGSFGYSSDNDSHWKCVVNSTQTRDNSRVTRRGRPSSEEEEKQEEVVQNDLKKFEGELYDKLTDMDLNYRNYYGFDNMQSDEKDSPKVLYFQEKMIKQQYGEDNYYKPSSYQSASNPVDYSRTQTLPTQSHARNMPELCQRAYSQDPRHIQNYGLTNGYESQNTSYRSLVSNSSGHFSSQDFIHASNDNISVHSGHSVPGNLYKTKYVSVDNINQNGKRTVFASSADIYNLFQSKENLATQLQRPASYRHSFHAVPVSVASGKSDPNDIFNERDEPRPRSSSTSVTSKNKSWNPFGSLFGKKRKSSTGGDSSKSTDKSSKSGNQTKAKVQTHHDVLIQNRQQMNATPEMLPRRQLVEEHGPVVAPVIKSSTLPRHMSSDKVFPDKPFKTIALFEESGTKLSTLV
ncbi:uncharacterized protein LOC143057856 [Mytilus galloprovincialis]|uniref:uncharacterized protein LOC143057856 n=1 Tax=Mytilus galloprovincialis TaxID=29158 RepID=UPI003F7BF1D7